MVFITLVMFTVTSLASEMKSDVIVFISFSMPKESIKGWMNEAAKINAPVVIRGLVNNSFRETLNRVNELTGDNKGGVQIDPMLFREYKVSQVPAVVVRNANDHDVVYGDAHLDYALQTVIKKSDELSPVANLALQKLRARTA